MFFLKLSMHTFTIVKNIKMHRTTEHTMLVWQELLQPHPGTSQVQRKDFPSSQAIAKNAANYCSEK